MPLRVSVLVPSYRRTADLERCLSGLALQQRPADEVLVVLRREDADTQAVVPRWQPRLPLRALFSDAPGQVSALNAGLDAVSGEIVMITDDDAVPQPPWIARVEAHFRRDPRLGGVGGRDVVHHGSIVEESPAKVVGRVLWFGRLVGNHHLIVAQHRPVDILKGANMSYRMAALDGQRFDTNLRGAGAQVGNDMAFSLALRKRGWRLLYDPDARVDHYPAARFDEDQRGTLAHAAAENMAFNTWWTLLRHLPAGPRRWAALRWEELIGTQARPGLVRGLLARLRRDHTLAERSQTAHQARRHATAAYKRFAAQAIAGSSHRTTEGRSS